MDNSVSLRVGAVKVEKQEGHWVFGLNNQSGTLLWKAERGNILYSLFYSDPF